MMTGRQDIELQGPKQPSGYTKRNRGWGRGSVSALGAFDGQGGGGTLLLAQNKEK